MASEGRSSLFAYPNPVKDRVTVDPGEEYAGSTVSLLNTAGLTLQQLEVQEEGIVVDLSRYVPGVYLLRMHDGRVVRLVRE